MSSYRLTALKSRSSGRAAIAEVSLWHSSASPEVLGGARVGDAKLRQVEWVDDDNVLVTVSSTSPPPIGFIGATREWFQLLNFSLTKLKVTPLSFEVSDKETFNVVSGETAVREVSGHSTLFVPGYCVVEGTVPCLFSFTYPERRIRLIDQASE